MLPFLCRTLTCVAILIVLVAPLRADETAEMVETDETVEEHAAPEVEIPTFPRSLPANPWVVQPAPIDVTLLFMPTVTGGKYRQSGVVEDYLPLRMFESAAPDGMAIVGRTLVREVLKSVARFDPGGEHFAEDGDIEALRRFFAATHVVETTMERDEDSRRVVVRLHTAQGVEETSFESPWLEEVTSGNRVAQWLVEQMSDVLTADEQAHVLRPLHGRAIASVRDGNWKAMTDDVANPGWTEWIAEYPEADYLRYMRVDRVAKNEQRELYSLTVPPPSDGTAGPLYLGGRGRVLCNLRQTDAGFHDYEIILARYPGITGQVDVYLHNWHDNQSKRTQLLRNADRWHAQMPPSGAWDMLLARTHLMAARAWMDGTSEGVSRNAVYRNVLFHAQRVRELINRAVERGGPVPEMLDSASVAAFLLQDGEWFQGLTNATITEFPESIASYRGFLTYTALVGTFGSKDMARPFIMETLESRKDWLHAAQLYDDYLLGFKGMPGRLDVDGIKGEITANVLRKWITDNPGWDEVTSAVARHIVRNNPTDSGAARAITYAWLARDTDLLEKIVADYPRTIFMENDDLGPVVKRTFVRHPVMNALRRADQLDVALEYTTDLFENHQECCLDRWSAYQLEHIHAHHALMLAYNGRAAEGDAYWEKAGDCTCLDHDKALSWAYSGHRLDEVRAHIAKVRGEGRRVSTVTAAEVILLAREGSAEQARALAKSRGLLDRTDHPLFQRILHEHLESDTKVTTSVAP